VPEIVLCRHGATEHNLSKRFLSTTDLPLGALGRSQCEHLRLALRDFGFERCFVSPMRRALETRELVVPDVPFEIESALCEVDFGSWEGHTLEWAQHQAPELLAQRRQDPVHFRPPGGESIADAASRVRPLLHKLRKEDATLVIGHRITLAVLERLLRNLPLDSRDVAGLEAGEFRIVPA
jgi:broad specificity phosphatase PhoE